MSNHYVSAESKYKDNLDSAISLLIVGILGARRNGRSSGT